MSKLLPFLNQESLDCFHGWDALFIVPHYESDRQAKSGSEDRAVFFLSRLYKTFKTLF